MGLEKRHYPRFYFPVDRQPPLILQTGLDPHIPAELLNISASGLCLSVSYHHKIDLHRMDGLRIKSLDLDDGLTIQNTSLKACYTFPAKDLRKVVFGLEFCDLPPERREQIALYVQDQAEREDIAL